MKKFLPSSGFTLIKAGRLEQVQWRSSFDRVQPKGFTLIELMVAIAIVAILSTVGLVVFSNAQAAGRDGKRRSDLDAIAKALESGRQAGGISYTWVTSSGYAGNQIPADPKSSWSSYCLKADSTIPPVAPPAKPGNTDPWTSSGCPAGGWSPMGSLSAPSFGSPTSWTVCAVLEQGTNSVTDGSNKNVFCKYSSQ